MTTATETTFPPGQKVRASDRLFGPKEGTVLGPVAGDPARLWVWWERGLAVWNGPLQAELAERLTAMEGASDG